MADEAPETQEPQGVPLRNGSRTTVEFGGDRELMVLHGTNPDDAHLWLIRFKATDRTQQQLVLPDDAARALGGIIHTSR